MTLTSMLVVLAVALVATGVLRILVDRERQRWIATLGMLEHEPTGLLTEDAVHLRMEPDLDLSLLLDQPFSVLVIAPADGKLVEAGTALAAAMRAYECAFVLDSGNIALGLWDTDEAGVDRAWERLSSVLDDHGVESRRAHATAPDDGYTAFALIDRAASRIGSTTAA